MHDVQFDYLHVEVRLVNRLKHFILVVLVHIIDGWEHQTEVLFVILIGEERVGQSFALERNLTVVRIYLGTVTLFLQEVKQ